MSFFRKFIYRCLPIGCARRHFKQNIINLLIGNNDFRSLFLHVLKDIQVWSEINIRITFLAWIIQITSGKINFKAYPDVDWDEIIAYNQKRTLSEDNKEKFIKHKIYREFNSTLFELIFQVANNELGKIKKGDPLITEIHCAFKMRSNTLLSNVVFRPFDSRPDADYLIGKYGIVTFVQRYQLINTKYREAVLCWLLCAKTFLPSKDMRLYIAKMLWNKRTSGVFYFPLFISFSNA